MVLSWRGRRQLIVLVAGLCIFGGSAWPQAGKQPGPSDYARTERYFEQIRKDPNRLLPFLLEMPKGGDLHIHLTGSIYAESYIRWLAEEGNCVDPATLKLSPAPCNSPVVPASKAFADPSLYGRMIDGLSTRNWQYSGKSAHDAFFDAFGNFSLATEGVVDKMLAETASRAASQHEIYQEPMFTPAGPELDALAKKLGWDDNFAVMQKKLMANGLPQILASAAGEMKAAEESRQKILKCGGPAEDPGCHVEQRFIAQVSRGKSKEVVFAQMLAGFMLAGADPKAVPPYAHSVGINLVMAEDWYVPMHDFPLHMKMLGYLHEQYPHVHIALHAGELVVGAVPPEDLRYHIRDSVELGHAERIGHGIDVMNETQPFELLQDMAKHNVMVEICLTSNDMILGVRGPQHPLHEYMRAGVPVALATDDEGVARSDMTHEYMKAAQEQELSYAELKKMARTSLEHGFLAGASLWSNGNSFVAVKACAADSPGSSNPTAQCERYLRGSQKAQLQWKLEAQFREFEAQAWPVAEKQPPAQH